MTNPRYNLEALEFAAVTAELLPRLQTPLARTGLPELGPLPDAETARTVLRRVAALCEAAGVDDRPPLPRLDDVRGWLSGFFAGSHQPDLEDLAELKKLLAACVHCRAWLRRGAAAALGDWALRFPELGDLHQALDEVVDEAGEVRTTASQKLAEVRREIEVAEAGVRAAVQRFLADERVYRHLQNPEPSWRHGRPVFQVRQESRGQVQGVLHDRSSSGATLFIEPQVVVAAANTLSDARAAEHREIQVILARVCRGLRRYREDLDAAVVALIELDITQAKARWVIEDGWSLPEITTDGVLRLEQARHPLLLRNLPRAEIQPLTLELGPRFHVLVVTGPNTGGKTVVLKTLGLLSLMAQSGMPIPAAPGCQVHFFDGVFVDVGDEQGIDQNLSTFSSHITRISACLQQASADSLVLIDELGAGTDPEEGGALGYAVLQRLERQRVRAVVSTHLGRLKDFAYQHAGAENGSMAFDRENHAPLYRLELGIPGASHALDIAERVGLDPELVEKAREQLGRRDERMEEAIERVHQARQQAEESRRQQDALLRSADAKDRQLGEQLSELGRQRVWLEEEADQVVEEAMRSYAQDLRDGLRKMLQAPKPFAEVARELEESLEKVLRDTNVHRRRMKFLGSLRKNGVVWVPRLAKRCTVKKVDRTREVLTIEVGKMRMEIPFEDVSWIQPLE